MAVNWMRIRLDILRHAGKTPGREVDLIVALMDKGYHAEDIGRQIKVLAKEGFLKVEGGIVELQ